jgi:hypothetical protein
VYENYTVKRPTGGDDVDSGGNPQEIVEKVESPPYDHGHVVATQRNLLPNPFTKFCHLLFELRIEVNFFWLVEIIPDPMGLHEEASKAKDRIGIFTEPSP